MSGLELHEEGPLASWPEVEGPHCPVLPLCSAHFTSQGNLHRPHFVLPNSVSGHLGP